MPVTIALVDQTGTIDRNDLAQAAADLTVEARRLADHWDHIPVASYGVWPTPPAGTWTINLCANLSEPGALGYHTDEQGQPVSYVDITEGDWDATTVTIDHEGKEMLADPFGFRLHGGRLPRGAEGSFKTFGLKTQNSHVQYLLEVCDPHEAVSYRSGDTACSDFLLPNWYTVDRGPGSFFSQTNSRIILPGGYVSFMTPDQTWWQLFNVAGSLRVRNLGKFDKKRFGSLRVFTDWHGRHDRARGAHRASQGIE
jgi:hypothetical protein